MKFADTHKEKEAKRHNREIVSKIMTAAAAGIHSSPAGSAGLLQHPHASHVHPQSHHTSGHIRSTRQQQHTSLPYNFSTTSSSAQSVNSSNAAQLAAVAAAAAASSPQLTATGLTTNPYLLLTLAAQQQQQQQQLAATALALQQQLAAISASQASAAVDPSSLALASAAGLTSPSLLTTGLPLHFASTAGGSTGSTASTSGGSSSSPSGVSVGSNSSASIAAASPGPSSATSPNGHLSSSMTGTHPVGLFYPTSSCSSLSSVVPSSSGASSSFMRNPLHVNPVVSSSSVGGNASLLALANSMSAAKQLFGGLTTPGINSGFSGNNRSNNSNRNDLSFFLSCLL